MVSVDAPHRICVRRNRMHRRHQEPQPVGDSVQAGYLVVEDQLDGHTAVVFAYGADGSESEHGITGGAGQRDSEAGYWLPMILAWRKIAHDPSSMWASRPPRRASW